MSLVVPLASVLGEMRATLHHLEDPDGDNYIDSGLAEVVKLSGYVIPSQAVELYMLTVYCYIQ